MMLPAGPLRALSIRQPWAMSIVQGTKRIENRGWDTRFRGPFLIHAAKGMTRDELFGWGDMIKGEDISWPGLRGRVWKPGDFERGGIIGAAQLVGVIRSPDEATADQHPWFFGPFGFVLAGVKAIPLIPCRGALGFFRPEPAIEQEARRRLAA